MWPYVTYLNASVPSNPNLDLGHEIQLSELKDLDIICFKDIRKQRNQRKRKKKREEEEEK